MSSALRDSRIAALVVLVLAALFVLPLLGGFGMMGGGMWGGGMWGSGGMWGTGGTAPAWVWVVGLLVRVLVLAVVVGLVYLLFRAVTGDDGRDAAVEELRKAYARGDLSEEEYERRRERLREE